MNLNLKLFKTCLLFSVLLFVVNSLLIGCGNSGLNALAPFSETIQVQVNFCSGYRKPILKKIKYLFIIDHSSSNNSGQISDLGGYRRYSNLYYFIKDMGANASSQNSDLSFMAINFSSAITFGGGESSFVGPDQFLTNITRDWIGSKGSSNHPIPDDGGDKNYSTALSAAYDKIFTDLVDTVNHGEAQNLTEYHIVFMSDGIPYSHYSCCAVAVQMWDIEQRFAAPLQLQVQAIKSLGSDLLFSKYISNIEINTIYYAPDSLNLNYDCPSIPSDSTSPDAARCLLQKMALAGSGKYFEFKKTEPITYDSFSPVDLSVKMSLSDIWLENENLVWWSDGKIYRDSSASGIPDFVRLNFGGNLGVIDSDRNGVRDNVEFKVSSQICKSPSCSVVGREPYIQCSTLNQAAFGANPIYPSSTQTGFNDCENRILGIGLNGLSTPGNSIPDFLALKSSLAFSSGPDESQLDPFLDGLSNYQRLKQDFPLTASARTLPHWKSRVLSMNRIPSSSIDQECYLYSASNVHVNSVGDQIRAYLVENYRLVDDKPILRVAEKRVQSLYEPLVFYPEDFK